MINKLYQNCSVQLKLGEVMCEIEYNTGVQQGNNMAPIIFLYIMQAAIKTLKSKLTCNNLDFRYFPTKRMQQNNVTVDLALNPTQNLPKK